MSLLCTEIGRGHPFYLEGLIAALRTAGRDDLTARRSNVFDASRGLARAAWRAVRATYLLAGRGGLVAAAYGRARGGLRYDEPSPALALLGRDLRRWAGREGIVVVDHPLLVGALQPRRDVWYVHGEVVVPPEAIVRSAAAILVPWASTAQSFVDGGVARDRLVITGLCVDPLLARRAQAARARRRARLEGTAPLTVAVFSSGAEPMHHVRALSAAAVALTRAGHRVLVFARQGGRLQRAVTARAAGGIGPRLVSFSDRDQLDRRTAAHFDRLDLTIGPPHERTSWALALGLPMLVVGPDVGTFAPLNRAVLTEAGVARALEAVASDPSQLAGRLDALRRDGALTRMLDHGTGPRFDGFRRAAEALVAAAASRTHPG
ncbi:MAG: hypothetical protein KDK70_07310 [Myxococcales bacterium]|nr:hypothetical protein [Myxococcales bacterium]